MSPAAHEIAVREFLRDHPEFLPDVRWMSVKGRMELMLSTDAVIAFSEWAVRTGRCSARRGEEFRRAIRRQSGK